MSVANTSHHIDRQERKVDNIGTRTPSQAGH